MIQLHDKQFVPFISERNRVCHHKMVQQVEDDFIDETPIYRSFKRLFYGGF
jgi:hypoxanthine phosphoribosyltransferase